LSHTPRQCGLVLRVAGSYLQSNLLKDSHSIEPFNSLPNLGIALHFMVFKAFRLRIVSASAVLWLIVDPGWALARGWLFLLRLGKEKPRLAFRAAAVAHWLSGGVFWGSTRKNLTRIDRMKAAPVTGQRYALQSRSTVFPIGCDALS
jgi:hypothetical protein